MPPGHIPLSASGILSSSINFSGSSVDGQLWEEPVSSALCCTQRLLANAASMPVECVGEPGSAVHGMLTLLCVAGSCLIILLYSCADQGSKKPVLALDSLECAPSCQPLAFFDLPARGFSASRRCWSQPCCSKQAGLSFPLQVPSTARDIRTT